MNRSKEYYSITMSPEERDQWRASVDAEIGAMGREAAREAIFADVMSRSRLLGRGEQSDGQALPAAGALRGDVPLSNPNESEVL